jgi:hypothetical protein
MPVTERREHVRRQPSVSRADLYEVEWGGDHETCHLGHLIGDEVAEEGAHVDAREEVAGLSRSLVKKSPVCPVRRATRV